MTCSWGFEPKENDHGIDSLSVAETDQTRIALAFGHLEKRFLFGAEFITWEFEFDAQSPATPGIVWGLVCILIR